MICFDCNGLGGEKDVVCDDGSGPFYKCGICKGSGELSLIKWCKFKILFWWYNWAQRN